MYLDFELDPADTPLYAVIRIIRSTGARWIEHIVTDPAQPERLARIIDGYVLQITRTADYR